MALLKRAKRPIRRDAGALRDDRLFVLACDDTYAPKQYFDSFQIPRIQVHVVPTLDGSSAAMHVLDRLAVVDVEEDDERWLILDTDHYIEGAHQRGFVAALRRAKQMGVRVALSRPCFEVWLAMHFLDDISALTQAHTATDVCALLGKVIGKYDKTDIDQSRWTFTGVARATASAKRLDKTVAGGDIPDGVTTRVYLLWEAIAEKALATQLPEQLRQLRGN